jgi:hypothetical protein
MRADAPSAVRRAACAIAAAIGANRSVRNELRRLLVAAGRLPSNARGRPDDLDGAITDATFGKLLDILRALLELALPQSVEDDSAYLAGLRRFFLERQDAYSLAELAVLWRISVEDVREVFEKELADWARANPHDPDGLPIHWADALRTSITYNIFRPIDVERALAADFDRVRSSSWRTVPLLIYVPRFMVDALEFDGVMASYERPPSARIEQYLFDLFPYEHRQEFAAALHDGGTKP